MAGGDAGSGPPEKMTNQADRNPNFKFWLIYILSILAIPIAYVPVQS
jgi:hypothetical protein